MAQTHLPTRIRQTFTKVWQTILRERGIVDSALASFDLGEQLQTGSSGVIQSGRFCITANIADTETVTIGGHVFKAMTTLAAADTFTQVKVLGSAALSRAAFLDALNGVSNVNVVPATTTFQTAMAALGVFIVADEVDTDWVRLRCRPVNADGSIGELGGIAAISVTLAETLAGSGNIVGVANLNATGAKPSGKRIVTGQVTITAAMITATKVFIEMPWTPAYVQWDGYASTGIKRAVDEAVTIDSNAIKLALAGGGSPNWQAGDFFRFTATEA